MVAKNLYGRKKRSNSFHNAIFIAVFLCIFLGVISVLVFQNVSIYKKRAGLQKKEAELKAQIVQLQTQKFELESIVTESQGQDYQEKVLREQGLYKKPGEEVVTVLPSPAENAPSLKEQAKKVWWDPTTWFGGN